jgi:hypothetical protein
LDCHISMNCFKCKKTFWQGALGWDNVMSAKEKSEEKSAGVGPR